MPHPVLHHSASPQRASAGGSGSPDPMAAYARQPNTDEVYALPTAQPWFPEGGVAAPDGMVVSPLTKDVANGQPNQLVGPATAEWVVLRDSHVQGQGVPSFKQWPRQFHSEAYNFNQQDFMPFPDQVGPILLAEQNAKAEVQGWSVPKYYEQYQENVADSSLGTGVVNTSDPSSVALAIGWGYVG
jgi:hypothetical protein